MAVIERKRIVVDETDDGCTISVWNNRHHGGGAGRTPDKVEVFESGADARDFLVAECAGFNWGGAS